MSSSPIVRTGRVTFRSWETWYIVYGELQQHGCPPPLVMLHGGPGAGCATQEVLGKLNDNTGRPVVLYDQVGCGRSTHLPDEPKETFTIDFFLEELDNLLQHLGVKQYHLLGHSWGGMLALEHAVRQPVGLKRLILEGTPASGEICSRVQHGCWRSLGEEHYKAVEQHDRDGIPTKVYDEASALFLSTFVCRLRPTPEVVHDGLQTILEARNVCDALWGISKDLETTGSLKSWSIIPRIPLIKNKVLVITGDHDYCGGEALNPLLNGSAEAEFVKFENCGHLVHLDAEQEYLALIERWLS